MKLGICMKMDSLWSQYPILTDFVELRGEAISGLTKEDYNILKKAVNEGKIRTYSANALVKDQILVGPEVDFGKLKEYIESLFYKLAELNISMIVFGSGKVKNVPEGFPREKAWEQLFEFGHILSSEAEKYGQMIAVEPLATRETNILNTVEEAAYYIKNVNRKNFKYLVDFFHFDYNNDDYRSIEKYADDLVHVHFASQEVRKLPVTDEDWSFVEMWLTLLKRIGYKGEITYEGGIQPSEELNKMFIKFREIERKVEGILC